MADFSLQSTVEIDGRELEDGLRARLEQIVVDDSLHLPDMFELTFRDGERTVLADPRMKPGSLVRVLATEVGGSTPEALVTGEVTALEAEYTPGGSRVIVRGYDLSHRLQRGRLTKTYCQMKDSDIARQIAERQRIEIGTIDDSGEVHDHVSQANQTDWAFLAERAREIGFELTVADGKFHFRKPAASEQAPPDGDYETRDPLALVLGGSLLELYPRISAGGQVTHVEVRGWDYKKKEEIVAESAARASSATLEATPGGLASTFGEPRYLAAGAPVGSQKAADAAAVATCEAIGSAFAEADGVAQGHPKLRPGAVVKITVADKPFEGGYVITKAKHVFGMDGYRVHFTISGRQDRSISALSNGGGSAAGIGGGAAGGVAGVVPAIVTNNDDPEKLARIKVKFPWLSADYESDWARLCSLGAGPDSGAVFIPEVNDEVLVAFEFGDIRRPYVVGSLWNGQDKPRLADRLFDNGKVERRYWFSRTGHLLEFNDGSQQSGVLIRTAGDHLNVSINETEMQFKVRSDGTLVLESTGDLSIKSSANVTIEASAQLNLKGAMVSIQGSGPVDIDGSPIQLN